MVLMTISSGGNFALLRRLQLKLGTHLRGLENTLIFSANVVTILPCEDVVLVVLNVPFVDCRIWVLRLVVVRLRASEVELVRVGAVGTAHR